MDHDNERNFLRRPSLIPPSPTGGDQSFLTALSAFRSQDLSHSTNQEFLILKRLIDGEEERVNETISLQQQPAKAEKSRAEFVLFHPRNEVDEQFQSQPQREAVRFVGETSTGFTPSAASSSQVYDWFSEERMNQFVPESQSNANVGQNLVYDSSGASSSSTGLLQSASAHTGRGTEVGFSVQDWQISATTTTTTTSSSSSNQHVNKRARLVVGNNNNNNNMATRQQQGPHQQLALLRTRSEPIIPVASFTPPLAQSSSSSSTGDEEDLARTREFADIPEVNMLRSSRQKHHATTTAVASSGMRLRTTPFPASVHGETRLNIKFISLGEPGPIPQRFGKNGCGIPHGLSGTHQMYDQRWKFQVLHVPQGNSVVIRWVVTNLSSGTVTAVTETLQDAMVRETCGRTICNTVLKNALEIRAVELENSPELYDENPTKSANVQNLIKVLRPKRCTVGLLFFGLLHEVVQKTLERNLADAIAASASSSLMTTTTGTAM